MTQATTKGRMMKTLMLALVTLASAQSIAQTTPETVRMYRCGNAYQDFPCADKSKEKQVEINRDLRTDEQIIQRQTLTDNGNRPPQVWTDGVFTYEPNKIPLHENGGGKFIKRAPDGTIVNEFSSGSHLVDVHRRTQRRLDQIDREYRQRMKEIDARSNARSRANCRATRDCY